MISRSALTNLRKKYDVRVCILYSASKRHFSHSMSCGVCQSSGSLSLREEGSFLMARPEGMPLCFIAFRLRRFVFALLFGEMEIMTRRALDLA